MPPPYSSTFPTLIFHFFALLFLRKLPHLPPFKPWYDFRFPLSFFQGEEFPTIVNGVIRPSLLFLMSDVFFPLSLFFASSLFLNRLF